MYKWIIKYYMLIFQIVHEIVQSWKKLDKRNIPEHKSCKIGLQILKMWMEAECIYRQWKEKRTDKMTPSEEMVLDL